MYQKLKRYTKIDIPHEWLAGVNVAGMGQALYQLPFADGSNGFSTTTQDIDYLVSKGFNCFRLLISQETLQSNDAWAGGNENNQPYTDFHAANFAKFKTAVNYATSQGVYVIIGRHQGADGYFGKYRKNFLTSQGGTNSGSILADFWRRMVDAFGGDNPMIGYSVDNEPLIGNSGPYDWWNIAQTCIDAIRRAGGRQTIFVAGISYQGASQWSSAPWNNPSGTITGLPGSNANLFLTLNDTTYLTDGPNIVAETHNYFSAEDSGAVENNVASGTVGRERMANVVAWCNANNTRVFVGEFGSRANITNANENIIDFVSYMKANSTALNANKGIVGAAWWAYGSTGPTSTVTNGWSNYAYTLSKQGATPPNGTDSVQMTLLITADFFSDPVPAPPFNPLTDVPNVYAYYNPANASVTGGLVDSVADSSGLAADANKTLTATVTKPAYTATDARFNNQPSIGNNGGNATALLSGLFTTPIPATSTYYLVGYATNPPASTVYWRHSRDNSTTITACHSLLQYSSFVASTNGSNNISRGSITTGLWIVAVVHNGASSRIYANSLTAATTGNTASNTSAGMGVGNATGNNGLWAIGDHYIYTSAHSNADVGKMMTYLASKYAVTLT